MRVPLKFDVPEKAGQKTVRDFVTRSGVHTVCEESACPNLGHCWESGTATFMIMGDRCTRRCKFCNIQTKRPLPLDPEEPERLGQTIRDMKLRHAVITSVDRDDLEDCGSAHFAKSIRMIRKFAPHTKIEVLIPDFKGREKELKNIWNEKPDIINHNVETVPSLYKEICPQSNYENSLKVLRLSAKAGFLTKSGIILGMGESITEVQAVMAELRKNSVKMLTLGQYMPPTPFHAPLREWIEPRIFEDLKQFGLKLGFLHVESGPLVRSSYHASEGSKKLLDE